MEYDFEDAFNEILEGILNGSIDFNEEDFKTRIRLFEKVIQLLKKKRSQVSRHYYSGRYDIYVLTNRILCLDNHKLRFKDITKAEFNKLLEDEEMIVIKFNALNNEKSVDGMIAEHEGLVAKLKVMYSEAKRASDTREFIKCITGSK